LILLSDLVDQARAQNRFVAVLAAMLAGIALLLACIGIAGVTAYSISRRTSEIGIRMTLGATRSAVLRMIFGQNFVPVITGLAIGLAASLALTPLLRSMLFGVKPSDPLAFALISVLLVLVGALACYFPARRAIQIEPTIALRYE
jgi:putative ABC transport system permease protein